MPTGRKGHQASPLCQGYPFLGLYALLPYVPGEVHFVLRIIIVTLRDGQASMSRTNNRSQPAMVTNPLQRHQVSIW